MMADVKWIKITTDIFDDEKMLLIESLPDADSIIVIWFKLLCLAGKMNNSGVFTMNNKIAYTDKMLSTIFRRKESTVQLALHTFEQYGMIEMVDDVITIPNWDKHQSLDAYEQKKERDRVYQAERRKKQKLLALKSSDKSSDSKTIESSDVEKNRSIEEDKNKIRIEKDIDNISEKKAKHKYGEYQHVMLTDNEYENIGNAYGWDMREKAIKFLDEYIEEKGYKSKSHNLAIRRWVVQAVQDQEAKNNKKGNYQGYQKQTKAQELDDSYAMMAEWAES